MAGRRSLLLEALDRSTAQSDCGFKSKWSCEEVKKEDCPVNTEKNETNLLSTDGEETEEPKTKTPFSSESVNSTGFLKNYTRRNQGSGFAKTLKGNATGLNMLGFGKKPSETVTSHLEPNKEIEKNQNKNFVISGPSSPGSVVRGRRFLHANVQSIVKTAAQSNLGLSDLGKEYPADVQRVPMDSIILMESDGRDVGSPELEQMYSVPNIKRHVSMKRLREGSTATLTESTALEAPATQNPACPEEETRAPR